MVVQNCCKTPSISQPQFYKNKPRIYTEQQKNKKQVTQLYSIMEETCNIMASLCM